LSILKREDVPVLVNFEPEPQSLNARGNG